MADTLQNQIERYLFNEMDEAEKSDFTAQLNSDSKLREEVELTAMIIAATREVGERNDLSEIEILKQTTPNQISQLTSGKKNNRVLKIGYWVATSAAVVLLAITINHFYNANSTTTQLFANYYQPFTDDSGVHRGGDTDIEEKDSMLLARAMILYEKKQYANALLTFNNISDRYEADIAIYKAICLLETGKEKQASQLLENAITKNGEGWEYYQDSQWYLALAYLKAKQVKHAKEILQKIVDNDRVYAEKALELLNQL